MITAYFDASVILRLALQEPGELAEWESVDFGVSSALLRVECFRGLDRMWHAGRLTESELMQKRTEVGKLLRYIDVVSVDRTVLRRASQPLPVALATLDAIHLATALLVRERQPHDERALVLATHDRALARAAEAMHFEVIGVQPTGS